MTTSSACGSDLHLLDGYVPGMRSGDIIGHEFMGEIVETGPAVRRHAVGDRVVVGSVIGCGECWHCRNGDWSLCDNSNPTPAALEALFGQSIVGIYGYSHLVGGFAGSHAEYVRVPFADHRAFPVPEDLSDHRAVFASDALATGWTGAEMAGIRDGDVVVVFGAGGVGLMATHAAYLLGAGKVLAVDRVPERLLLAEQQAAAVPVNYEETSVSEAVLEATGGRGADVAIEAVGMEAHGGGLQYAYDRVKQATRQQTERSLALRDAVYCTRKGGTVVVLGVFVGWADKFPLGAVMNKALTVKAGQQVGQRYIPMLLERIVLGDVDPSYLATHPMPLDEAPRGYALFKHKDDGCVRAVFHPHGAPSEP